MILSKSKLRLIEKLVALKNFIQTYKDTFFREFRQNRRNGDWPKVTTVSSDSTLKEKSDVRLLLLGWKLTSFNT